MIMRFIDTLLEAPIVSYQKISGPSDVSRQQSSDDGFVAQPLPQQPTSGTAEYDDVEDALQPTDGNTTSQYDDVEAGLDGAETTVGYDDVEDALSQQDQGGDLSATSPDAEFDDVEDGLTGDPADAPPGEEDPNAMGIDGVPGEPESDPDKQGVIRVVPDAHLVYKRKNEQNQYTELWVYKRNLLQHDNKGTHAAILAGSDIPKGRTSSEDGTQTLVTWEIGPPANLLTFVQINGLTA